VQSAQQRFLIKILAYVLDVSVKITLMSSLNRRHCPLWGSWVVFIGCWPGQGPGFPMQHELGWVCVKMRVERQQCVWHMDGWQEHRKPRHRTS